MESLEHFLELDEEKKFSVLGPLLAVKDLAIKNVAKRHRVTPSTITGLNAFAATLSIKEHATLKDVQQITAVSKNTSINYEQRLLKHEMIYRQKFNGKKLYQLTPFGQKISEEFCDEVHKLAEMFEKPERRFL